MVEAVDERNVEEVMQLIREVIEPFEPAEVVTDEAPVYEEALQRLAQEEGDGPIPVHWLCAGHSRRDKARRLSAWARSAQEAGRPLLALEARALQMRMLTLELWEKAK